MEPHTKLSALLHPYERLEPVRGGRTQLKQVSRRPGSALVWRVEGSHRGECLRLVRERPGGVALIAVLPPAPVLESSPELLQAVLQTRPHGLLPHHVGLTAANLAEVLRRPPADLGAEVTDYLTWRGLVVDKDTRNVLRRIVDLSARARTVTELSRAMYLSRRALGRRLSNRGLPVPSHWLQVARVLRLVSRLQNSDANIFSIAYEFGYPDGFSVSNQMYRLVGFRPSLARERLGWEWVLEAWLRREADGGGLVPRAAAGDVGDREAVPSPRSIGSVRKRRQSHEPTA